jgi:serine/threonine-protein kinase
MNMLVTRQCPSCATSLPDDAAFCHRCGAATPHEIDRATGEIRSLPSVELEEAANKERLQRAVGPNCEIRRLLGRGGFAEVYVGYDTQLKREIAVKTIRGDLVVSDVLLQRFQREAEAVAKLRHPNVIPVYGVGERDGVAFFTMPLIDGGSLADALDRQGTLPVAEAVRVLREAAHGLHAAHRAGLVHRDIKPENLMLEGAENSVIVMDFGIAKAGNGSEDKGLTGTGMLVGTPQYMSPEQAVGERTLDHRSDQYSLAMVGYRMLSGRLPFDGDSAQTQLFKAVTEVPAPLSDVAPEVPQAVSDAIAKALEKNPEHRFE